MFEITALGLLFVEIQMFTPRFVPCESVRVVTNQEGINRTVTINQVDPIRRREVKTETDSRGEVEITTTQYDALNRLSELAIEFRAGEARFAGTATYEPARVRYDGRVDYEGGKIYRLRTEWIDRNRDGTWDEFQEWSCEDCPTESGLVKNFMWTLGFSPEGFVSSWSGYVFLRDGGGFTFGQTTVERAKDGTVNAIVDSSTTHRIVSYWNQASLEERRKGQKITESIITSRDPTETYSHRYDSIGRKVSETRRLLAGESVLMTETTNDYSCRD